MPRLARIVIEGIAHHVVQRGNNRQDVFFVDDDYGAYLRILEDQSRTHGLKILAYCLMTNHVHLVAVPSKPESLAKAVGRANFLYTRYVNRLHGRSGHLWQGRFYSCALDDAHFLEAACYVEQNPVRAGLVKRAAEYPWSSAAAHVGAGSAHELLDISGWPKMMDPATWWKVLSRRPVKADVSTLRRSTERGWPLANDSFLSKLEKRLNRRLRPLLIGRPTGAKDKRRRKRRTSKTVEIK
jgi:putative transposase